MPLGFWPLAFLVWGVSEKAHHMALRLVLSSIECSFCALVAINILRLLWHYLSSCSYGASCDFRKSLCASWQGCMDSNAKVWPRCGAAPHDMAACQERRDARSWAVRTQCWTCTHTSVRYEPSLVERHGPGCADRNLSLHVRAPGFKKHF